MNTIELVLKLKEASGDECIDLVEKLQSGKIEEINHVGWQQRYIDKEEGASMWQFCDGRTAKILANRSDYELRKVFA